jgi:uncharacterized membrane protein
VEFAAITMSFGLLIISGILAVIARMSARDELPLNAEIGLRTKAIMASPAAWKAGHRAAAPVLNLCWVIGIALAAVIVIVGFVADDHWPVAVAGGIGYGAVIAVLLVGLHRANQAARNA